jgi:hypothetical protein
MAERAQRRWKRGDRNSEIRRIHLALHDAGLYDSAIDGVFGPLTERAVRAFQRVNGLEVDGVVGEATWRALFASAESGREASGEDKAAVNAASKLAEPEPEPKTGSKTGSGVASEDAEDISRSVAGLRRTLPREVSAYVVVAALLAAHPKYGRGLAGSVEVGEAPDGVAMRTLDGWVAEVRELFQPQEPGKLDGRKVVYGLALLEPDLRRRLGEAGFLAALEAEEALLDQLSARGRVLWRVDAVPTLSDRPATVDLLGRGAFAEALAERLRDEFQRTAGPGRLPDSFMLHLEGPWGSGKSSLLGFLETELRKEPEPWLVVEFNAWQNQRAGAPWWLLISAVLRQAAIDGNTGIGLRLRLHLRALWWRLQLVRTEIAVILLAMAVVGVLVWSGKLAGDDPLGILAGAITAVVAAVSGLRGLMTSVAAGSERGAQTFIQQTNDPMRRLERRFTGLVRDLRPRPVAILIDDLDRCRADYVVDLLEGVQTIFREAPVAFVVAADRHWLYDAYATVYGDYMKTGIDPGRPLGHLFLEKAFQLSTSVPSISPSDQRAFWERLLAPPEAGPRPNLEALASKARDDFAALETEDKILGELNRDPGGTPEERRVRREAAVRRLSSPTLQRHIEHTLTRFAPLLEPNPRAMKRLVNSYGVARAVQILEDRPTALTHPRERLALWTVLKARWPLLADYLATHPDSVEDLKANRVPTAIADDGDRPYLRRVFEDGAAQRVARGEGLDGIELDPVSLRFLIDGPGAEPPSAEPGGPRPAAEPRAGGSERSDRGGPGAAVRG